MMRPACPVQRGASSGPWLCGLRLCCLALMDQAPGLDGQCLDLLPFCQDCRAASAVDISGREVAEAFVIAVIVVMLDKGRDGRLEIALKIVVFRQNAVPEGLVPALDLALRLGWLGARRT